MSSKWFADWQSPDHVTHFDFRSELSDQNLRRNYHSYNDFRLLLSRMPRDRTVSLLEVGCATGELARYLAREYPQVRYAGVDISKPALDRARQKYPQSTFIQGQPGQPLAELLAQHRLDKPTIVFAKDVMHHQDRPLGFLSEMIRNAAETVVLRCRTRDTGPTEWDPERSCQYHYGGWMPYIIINVDDLVGAIRADAPDAEIRIVRHHMVLGGKVGRFVPKECYLEEIGTAETAVGIFLTTDRPRTVTVEDQVDMNPQYTVGHLLGRAARRAARLVRGR